MKAENGRIFSKLLFCLYLLCSAHVTSAMCGLGCVLTSSFYYFQAEQLHTGKAPYKWDDESMYKAMEVRVNTSRVQYEWLRNNCLPLPSLSTLQRWLADFTLMPNSAEVQVKMLRRLLSPMSERDRCCCIMMDEMDIMGVATYDNQLDQVLGPHKHLQLFLVSGIFKTWKLPMLYAFDTPVTKELLLKGLSGFRNCKESTCFTTY